MIDTSLICIIYDSIDHSIFESQVLTPLLKRFKQDNYQNIYIISFEQIITSEILQLAQRYQSHYPAVSLTLFKRSRFINTYFLKYEIDLLKNFLKTFSYYTLIARGPLAGYIAQKAITTECNLLIIQARGLLAQEYVYTHRHAPLWKKPLLWFRTWQLKHLEQAGFSLKNITIPFCIEAVSDALQDYLEKTYDIKKDIFIPAVFDIPATITQQECEMYNQITRTILRIPLDAIVYVYSGSLKPWQCPQQTIDYFKQVWQKNKNSLFLGLTKEENDLKKILDTAAIPENAYRVLSVLPKDIIQYLCAANYGFMLRETHIINWVSRPTKLLEYQAARIKIVHNNTIALLCAPKA